MWAFELCVLYSGLGLSVLGLALNLATTVGFAVALRRRPNFTVAWCVTAMAAADSLNLGLFVLAWLQGLGWGLSDSGFLNFCLPVFFVHFTSAFSAWVLCVLSAIYYVMVWRPLDFARRDWLRRPGRVLVLVLAICITVQLYIPFALEYDETYGTCTESFGVATGNWLLLLDGVVNSLLPTAGSLIIGARALVPPGLSSDKKELARCRESWELSGSGASSTAVLLTSGASREAARLSSGRRKLGWLAVLALGKLAANVPSQVFRFLEAAAPQLMASTSVLFPVAYILYYAQFCGQALFVFFLFASREKKTFYSGI